MPTLFLVGSLDGSADSRNPAWIGYIRETLRDKIQQLLPSPEPHRSNAHTRSLL